MKKPPIPYLYSVSPEEVQEVINDLELQRNGAHVFYAVDPYDVIDFCFPVNPTDSRNPDMRTIADDQAALYELFYVRTPKPVLLEEYAQEIVRHLRYIQLIVESEMARDDKAMLQRLVESADLMQVAKFSGSVLLEKLQSDFNIRLALAMGIYSLGAKRFKELSARLKSINRMASEEPYLEVASLAYRETLLADEIFARLREEHKNEEMTPLREEQRDRSARTDANAIDRLIFMNCVLEKAFLDRKIDHRCVLLYFSSATRNRRIFSQNKVYDALPSINGRPYSFWRTREQFFAYTVNKIYKDGDELDTTNTISNLYKFKQISIDVRRLERSFTMSGADSCEKCVLVGGVGDSCRWLPFCRRVEDIDKSIRRRRAEYQNLALIAGLKRYERFAVAKSSSDYREYMDEFRQIYEQRDIGDLALEKMNTFRVLMIAQSEFANMLPHALTRGDVESLREGRDSVTGSVQHLPIKPRITSEDYLQILASLVEYYRSSPKEIALKETLIQEAYDQYLVLETKVKGLDPEHELTRCFLYMAFPGKDGDQKAFDHAKKMMSFFAAFKSEFYYVLCWAGRRLKVFQETDKYIQRAIKDFPDDPRFHHAFALNILSWIRDKKTTINCPYKLRAAVDETQKAIDLYSLDEKRFGELIGANYNNLAYFLSAERLTETYDLPKAREALDQLKKYTSKEDWPPENPEYFQTEAQVEVEEFYDGRMKKRDAEYLQMKLTNAKREIETAIRLNPAKSQYVELKEEIDLALNGLSSETTDKDHS